MTSDEAMAFVRHHGVVLASAKGPVPRLAEAIAGEPIKGSWWAHPKSHQLFELFQAVEASADVLVCRLVDGKITYVHRRLWAALVRVAGRFPPERIAQVRQEHTASGRHVNHELPFPRWVPPEEIKSAKKLSEEQALAALGSWALTAGKPLARTKRRKD